jgi:hypothetical protein
MCEFDIEPPVHITAIRLVPPDEPIIHACALVLHRYATLDAELAGVDLTRLNPAEAVRLAALLGRRTGIRPAGTTDATPKD